jgi:hypothetical protein
VGVLGPGKFFFFIIKVGRPSIVSSLAKNIQLLHKAVLVIATHSLTPVWSRNLLPSPPVDLPIRATPEAIQALVRGIGHRLDAEHFNRGHFISFFLHAP